MSNTERNELNLKACNLIHSLGISITVTESNFDELREKYGYVGYAEYYLSACYDKTISKNEADIAVYKQLLEIDSQLGTTQTEQLFGCLCKSVRMDLIKVCYISKLKCLISV